jgi:hypothetical protein
MQNPLRALTFALEKYPERVEMLPLAELVIESARQNDKRPAYVKIAVPDDMVKALKGARGPETERDLVLLVRLPREVLERSESRIVLPGEVRR